VDLIARRFRGVLIALVVLGLSATAVFAGHVAFQAPATTPTAAEQGDQDDQADETDNETPDADENDDADDADSGTPREGTHGAFVSAAAKAPTPLGFANHGEFVSCAAHMPPPAAGTTVDQFLTGLTPTTCADAAAADQAAKDAAKADKVHGKSGQHGRGRNRD
jgi:hypothetical protein